MPDEAFIRVSVYAYASVHNQCWDVKALEEDCDDNDQPIWRWLKRRLYIQSKSQKLVGFGRNLSFDSNFVAGEAPALKCIYAYTTRVQEGKICE